MSKRDDPQFKLRLPVDLKEWLASKAQANKRSLSAEIQFRLDQGRLQEVREAA